jgi:hypothetical protein
MQLETKSLSIVDFSILRLRKYMELVQAAVSH